MPKNSTKLRIQLVLHQLIAQSVKLLKVYDFFVCFPWKLSHWHGNCCFDTICRKFMPRGTISFAQSPKLTQEVEFVSEKESSRWTSGSANCSFDNHAGRFLPGGQKNIVQSPKRTINTKTIKNTFFAQKSSVGHVESSLDRPAEFFPPTC